MAQKRSQLFAKIQSKSTAAGQVVRRPSHPILDQRKESSLVKKYASEFSEDKPLLDQATKALTLIGHLFLHDDVASV